MPSWGTKPIFPCDGMVSEVAIADEYNTDVEETAVA
jgi:hypothetical protein